MMVDVFFGELSKERQKDWNFPDDNPYAVLQNDYKIWKAGTDVLWYGKEYFHDQIQIDWGSFAWKCSIEEFKEYLKYYHLDVPDELDLHTLDKTKQYGMVFIEVY